MFARKKRAPTIRQYRRRDDPQIWALIAATSGSGVGSQAPFPLPPADAPPRGNPDIAHIGRVFLQSGGDFIVAEVDGAVAGTAGLIPTGEEDADIVRLVVHPALRRRGIGTALMETIEYRAAGLGIRRLNLDIGGNEQEAMAFYQSVGFHRPDEEDDEDDEDIREPWSRVTFFSKTI